MGKDGLGTQAALHSNTLMWLTNIFGSEKMQQLFFERATAYILGARSVVGCPPPARTELVQEFKEGPFSNN